MKTMLLLTIALAPAALRAQSQQCLIENATLNGAYTLSAAGTAGGTLFGGNTGPFAVLGIIVFDGRGNFQSTFTINFKGTVARGMTAPGSYTINRDCTGTMTINFPGPLDPHFDLVMKPDGRVVNILETDAGTIITGTAVRLDHN